MKEPIWVETEDCVAFHAEMLARFGGLDGIRDHNMLQSSLFRARQLHANSPASMPELAASYATGIIKNRPFLDGNKRTGFLCAAFFLEINGLHFHAPEVEVVERTLALAAGAIKESDYALWLKRSCD